MVGFALASRLALSALILLFLFDTGSTFQQFPVMSKPHTTMPYAISKSGLSARGARHSAILVGGRALSSQATLERTSHTNEQQAGKDHAEREFDLQRGFAVDTLLADYATLFESPCNFDIFNPDIVLKDAKGFTLEGLSSYKLFFKTVTNILSVVFSRCQTSVVLMDKYGIDKSKIKLRWRIELASRLNPSSWKQLFRWMDRDGDGILTTSELNDFTKSRAEPFGGHHENSPTWRTADTSNEPLVLEGISEYKLNAKGMIYEHTITVSYPATPWSLAPLQALLPVRRVAHPGLAGVAGMVSSPSLIPETVMASSVTADGFATQSTAQAGASVGEPVVSLEASESKEKSEGFFASVLPKDLRKKMPKQCKEDYDCNPGGYNFPKICQDFVFARFCIDPDDWRGGGLGALAWDPSNLDELIPEPIPVRPGDGYPGYPR